MQVAIGCRSNLSLGFSSELFLAFDRQCSIRPFLRYETAELFNPYEFHASTSVPTLDYRPPLAICGSRLSASNCLFQRYTSPTRLFSCGDNNHTLFGRIVRHGARLIYSPRQNLDTKLSTWTSMDLPSYRLHCLSVTQTGLELTCI